jgi:outer membrane scaffolding protein for murein synthesis (MipA/OmpV family)
MAAAGGAAAQTAPREAPLPLWEIGVGAGGLTQPAYPGARDRTGRALVLPYFVYRGPWLRADRDGVGLRAFKTPNLELDIGFAASLGSHDDDVEVRRGMADLGTLVEFGPRLRWKLGSLPNDGGRLGAEVALRGVFDLSDSLRRKGVSFEPRLTYERLLPGGWGLLGANAGFVVGDQRLAQTFYGVAAQEATATRPEFRARSGLIAWRLGANLSRDLTPDVRVFGFVRLDDVSGSRNHDSPLVQRDRGVSAGLGVIYTFARSAAGASE